jgi:hypothetical protein
MGVRRMPPQNQHVFIRSIQGFSSGANTFDCRLEIKAIALNNNPNRSGTVIGNNEVSYYPTGFVIECDESNLKTISLYDASTGFGTKEGQRNQSQETSFFSSVSELKSSLPPLDKRTHREANLPPGVRIYNEIEFKNISRDMIKAIYFTNMTPQGIVECKLELIENELKAIALQHACCREFQTNDIPISFYDPINNQRVLVSEQKLNPSPLLIEWIDGVLAHRYVPPQSKRSELEYFCDLLCLKPGPYLARLSGPLLTPNIDFEPTYALQMYHIHTKYPPEAVVNRAVLITANNPNNKWVLDNVLVHYPNLREFSHKKLIELGTSRSFSGGVDSRLQPQGQLASTRAREVISEDREARKENSETDENQNKRPGGSGY